MRRLALVSALLASCLGDPAPYRCDRAGGDRACDSVEGARCVRGYCAARVAPSVCPSGLRYTESAAAPGTCAPVDTDAATDVVTPPEDRPDAAVDAVDATAPQGDVVDVAEPGDVVDAFVRDDIADAAVMDASIDVVDAPAVMDVPASRDVVDAPAVMDVPTARDVVDVPAVMDVPTARDVVDVPAVMDAPSARDVADVVDAGCPVNARIVSPLPSERHLGRNLTVVTAANGDTTGLVAVLRLGIRCDGAETSTMLNGGRGQFFTQSRGYYCVALRQRHGGRDCQTPWRRIAVMANNYGNAAPHWGLWPDFNNDGYADLLMATASGVIVQGFVADGIFSSGSSPARPDDAQSAVALAAVGDVDGDGFGDAAITWALRGGARGVYLHRGGPMGLTAAPTRLSPIAPVVDPGYGEALVALGDRDGDGRTEVGVLTNARRTLRVAALNAQGAPVEHASLSYPSPMEGLAAGADVTGDNLPDIVLAAAGVVYVHSVGGVVMIPPPSPEQRDGFGRALATGSDFDHDGVSEVVISVPSAEEAHIYRYNGASFVPVTTTPIQSLERSALVAPGDMDTVAGDEVVVMNDVESIRVRRGGFDGDLPFTLRWSAPVGTLIAGTSTATPTGAFWFPRAAATGGRHGVVIARMAGSALAPQIADMLFSQPVTLVSP